MRKYYIAHGQFRNDYTLLYTRDLADINALETLRQRGATVDRIRRADALQRARKDRTVIYKATSIFVYDWLTRFGNDMIYMDHNGFQHGYKVL